MAEIRAIEIPKWGLTMEEGMLGSWHVAEGTSFTKGQALCTIESSKIANELEAPFDGFLRRQLAQPGDTYPVGALIAVSAEPAIPDAEVDAFIAARLGLPKQTADAPPPVAVRRGTGVGCSPPTMRPATARRRPAAPCPPPRGAAV